MAMEPLRQGGFVNSPLDLARLAAATTAGRAGHGDTPMRWITERIEWTRGDRRVRAWRHGNRAWYAELRIRGTLGWKKRGYVVVAGREEAMRWARMALTIETMEMT